ncbi:MAG: hypothetical protein HQL13_02565 [Candidatus Omnitrophica bacterium]|nr:hypothetical protein [Candidatus Omnitrophota bacterium]
MFSVLSEFLNSVIARSLRRRSKLNHKALSILEYMVLLICVITAFIIMKDAIQRGFFGVWAKTGQSFAYGRQYDAQRTVDCVYDPAVGWYDNNCFKAKNDVSQCSNPSCYNR